MRDPYETLGVAKDASKADVTRAYRSRAKKAHPDAGGEPETFHALAKAYDVLRDDAKRQRYDQTGEIDDKPEVNPDATAIQMLDMILQSVIERGELTSLDLVGSMRSLLAESAAGVKTELASMDKKHAALVKQKTRLERKPASSDIFAALLDTQIRLIGERLARGRENARHLDQAKELLEGYSSKPDPAARTSVFTQPQYNRSWPSITSGFFR